MASSAEDIAGTWHSTNTSAEIQFNEDGTVGLQFKSGANYSSEFWFEGTRLIWKTLNPGNDCVLQGAETGIYEVELLENGNLKLTVIEDECAIRVTYFTGALIEREWEPVP